MLHASLLVFNLGLMHMAKSCAISVFHFMGYALRMVGISQKKREQRFIYVKHHGIPNVKLTKFLKRRDGTIDSAPSSMLRTPKCLQGFVGINPLHLRHLVFPSSPVSPSIIPPPLPQLPQLMLVPLHLLRWLHLGWPS